MRDAFLFDAVRTPRGRGKPDGSLYSVKPVDLVVTLLKALQQRNDLNTRAVDDLVLGCVTPIGEQGADIARTAVLHAGWDQSVPGVTLNRFCASGLEAVNLAAMKVRSGWEDLVVAGGVESMSRVPMGADGGALFLDPSINFNTGFIPQGVSADVIASMEGFSREELDHFAVGSHHKAAAARLAGYFKKSMVAVKDFHGKTILDHDETVREYTSRQAMAKLKNLDLLEGRISIADIESSMPSMRVDTSRSMPVVSTACICSTSEKKLFSCTSVCAASASLVSMRARCAMRLTSESSRAMAWCGASAPGSVLRTGGVSAGGEKGGGAMPASTLFAFWRPSECREGRHAPGSMAQWPRRAGRVRPGDTPGSSKLQVFPGPNAPKQREL